MSKNTLYPFHLTPGGPALVRDIVKQAGIDSADPALNTLTIGSRYGEHAIALAEIIQGQVLAIEEDPEAVFYAKMAITQSGLASRVRTRFASPLSLAVPPASFDMVLLEGILSAYPRHKAMRQALQTLKNGGVIAISDSYWRADEVPTFVRDVWESANQKIATKQDILDLMDAFGLDLIMLEDRSSVLSPFYEQFTGEVKGIVKAGFEGMKHQKTLVKHYKHEIDVYLKHGGRKWMGYFVAVAKKQVNARSNNAGELP